MCHESARWPLLLLITVLAGILLPLNAYALSVCIGDFENTTRFISFDPLPDNLTFYMKGSPGLDVVDRWRVRGEVNPVQGLENMMSRAKSLGADVLITGKVSENAGKVVTTMTAYNIAASKNSGFQVTLNDALDCRDAASKASAMLRQHLAGGGTPETESISTIAVPELSTGSISDIAEEQRILAMRSIKARKRAQAVKDESLRSSDPVTQREFARVIARLANRFRISYDHVFTVTDPDAPVLPDEAFTAFTKGFGSDKTVQAVQLNAGVLSREDLAELLTTYMPPVEGLPVKAEVDSPSGLVIDARGLGLERSMSPIILSEDGMKLYPDPKHLPSIDYIEDQGIASFVHDLMKAPRSGSNPLIVRAIGVKGSASNIAVVSKEDADTIMKAAGKSDFIKEWKVTFLIDQGY